MQAAPGTGLGLLPGQASVTAMRPASFPASSPSRTLARDVPSARTPDPAPRSVGPMRLLGTLSPFPTAGLLHRARAGSQPGPQPQACSGATPRLAGSHAYRAGGGGTPPPPPQAAPPGGWRQSSPSGFCFCSLDSSNTWQLGLSRRTALFSRPAHVPDRQTHRQVFTHAGRSSVLPHIYPGTTFP